MTEQTATEKVTVVLGAGSPLMGDDGLGVEVVEALAERWAESPTLRFLDVPGQVSPPASIITLDRIATISDSFVEDGGTATYNGHPSQMIEVEKAPGEDAIAISDAVRASVPDLIAAVERQLRDWDHRLDPREALAGA